MADAKKLPAPAIAIVKMDKLTKGGYPRFNAKKEAGNQLVGQAYPEAKADWLQVKKARLTLEAIE